MPSDYFFIKLYSEIYNTWYEKTKLSYLSLHLKQYGKYIMVIWLTEICLLSLLFTSRIIYINNFQTSLG